MKRKDKQTFCPPAISRRGREIILQLKNSPQDNLFQIFPVQDKAIDFLNSSSSDDLKLFSIEKDPNGGRKYCVATTFGFYKRYRKMIFSQSEFLHWYEVIRENTPCKMYFDLEFKRSDYSNVDEDKLVDNVIDHLKSLVSKLWSTCVNEETFQFIELDSSTELKFSRHLIFPYLVLEDSYLAGAICKLVDKSIQNAAFEDIGVPIIDIGVYTKNRCFRLLGSSKFGKTSKLRVSTRSGDAKSFSKQIFYDSLICSLNRKAVLLTRDYARETLQHEECFGGVQAVRTGSGTRTIGRTCSSVFMDSLFQCGSSNTNGLITRGSSCYPVLDSFIIEIIGARGHIYSCMYPDKTSNILIYVIGGEYRYCDNIGRHHERNKIFFVCDLNDGTMYQKCFDPDCRAQNYRSPSFRIREDVLSQIRKGDEYKLDDNILMKIPVEREFYECLSQTLATDVKLKEETP